MELTKGVIIQELLENKTLMSFIRRILLDRKKHQLDIRMLRRIWQIGMNAYFQFEDDYQERTREKDAK